MEVLNTQVVDWEKLADDRAFLARIIGNGLVVVEGNEHREQRKNVTPALSGRAIKDLVPLLWSKGLSLVKAAKREAGIRDGTFDIMEVASRATLNAIGSAGLGKDFCSLEDAEHVIAEQHSVTTDPRKGSVVFLFVISQLFPLWLAPQLPLRAHWRLNSVSASIRRITKRLLAEKSQDMQESSREQKDNITMPMRSRKSTDDENHETTAGAMTWASYLISKQVGVQERLRKECQDVCGGVSNADEIAAEMVDSTHYLDVVYNEVLRWYFAGPIISRICARPIPIGDTTVVISPWALNRLPSLWGTDVDESHSERWTGPDGKQRGATSPHAFMTFLYWPRSFTRSSFARHELKCLLTTLLLHFETRLKTPDEVQVRAGAITIKPKDGIELVVTEIAAPT
ncbi:hypothetical protein LTR86_010944 [Recurvomyces mirabilis]|nr:hypothetical protein LTR86_010944 [Recurvomyces mirabilis]